MFYELLGLGIMYSYVHFIVLAFSKAPKERTKYEKVVSIVGVVGMSLSMIGILMG